MSPSIDFTTIDEAGSYSPVPDGKYRARLIDVEESATQHGDEMWKLTFSIIEGEHKGRQIFDNLVFSQKAAPRMKLICSRLGVDVSGTLDLKPNMLLDRVCLLTVEIQEYQDTDGRTRKGNRVPYSGYECDQGGGEDGKGSRDDAVPF